MPSLDRILSGPSAPENITDGTKSLGEFCLRRLKAGGDMTLLINQATEEQVTASEFRAQSVRVARALLKYGIRSGDRVGIFSENNVEYCNVIFGTLMVGATVVPISPFFTEIELHNAYGLSKPTLIFASHSTFGKILKLTESNPEIKNVIIFGESTAKCQSFNEFLNSVMEDFTEDFVSEPEDIENNVALILSSSGTTGLPKGVQLTQQNIFAATANMSEAYDVIPLSLVMAPLSYVTGFMFMFPALVKPKKTVLLEKFDPYKYLSCIEKFQMPLVFFNQSMMNLLAKKPVEKEYDLSSLVIVFYGGAAVSQNVIASIESKMPNLVLLQAYGITECYGLTCQTPTACSPGSIGILQKGTLGKVVNPQTGAILGPNEQGELMFKNLCLMKGYTDPEANVGAFGEDGFLHTGDIGYYDEQGEWYIVDRLKELIKYCGMQVYPAEVECVLMGHPAVSDACVVGLPDDECGELPLAFIVKQSEVTADEIIDYAAEHLSLPQHLRGGVIFVEKIPENNSGSGKSHRRVLREMAQSIINTKK